MYENNFQSRAIFLSGPFLVNPHSCERESNTKRPWSKVIKSMQKVKQRD